MKTSQLLPLVLFSSFGLSVTAEALDFPFDRQISPKDAQAATDKHEECLVIDKNRDLHIPCVRYKGVDYQFTIRSFINPIDALKTVWKMDPQSLSPGSGETCVEAGDDKHLVLPCVSFRGAKSGLVLNYHENPSDPLGVYWTNSDLPEGSCTPNEQYAGYKPAAGCTCRSTWSYNGKVICGGMNRPGNRGGWLV